MKVKNIIIVFAGVFLAGLCGCADKHVDSGRQDDNSFAEQEMTSAELSDAVQQEVPLTELTEDTLEQYAADWSEDKLIEEINKRRPYRDNCSYYWEVVDYMENIRGVGDISIYIEPLFYTNTMIYTEEGFKEVPELILYLAKNEIYARHGYIFEDEDLKHYFMVQLWYLPTTTSAEFDDAVFNEYEKENLALLNRLLEESGTN